MVSKACNIHHNQCSSVKRRFTANNPYSSFPQLRKISLHPRGSSSATGPVAPPNRDGLSTNLSEPSVAFHGGDLRRTKFDENSNTSELGDQNLQPHESQNQDLLGLHLVRNVLDPCGDIIFVHGLGGMARKTWCHDRNLDYFWPPWLGEENGLSSFRIFTFGYNSNFKGARTNLNILDFAKDLLFQILTFSDASGANYAPLGHRAIFFVAHSMGGLVVKKAYVLGKQDHEYVDIISRVRGILFLATPHRGAQYAKILNNILSVAPFGPSSKAYVADLDIHSGVLQDINEQFRVVCGDLALVSFFETLKTSFGVTKVLVRFSNATMNSYILSDQSRLLRKSLESSDTHKRSQARSTQIITPSASLKVARIQITSAFETF